MRAAAILLVLMLGMAVYIAYLLYSRSQLRRQIHLRDDPLDMLTRRERRDWAREQLAKERDAYFAQLLTPKDMK